MEGNLDGFLPWTLFPFKESRNPGARPSASLRAGETRGLLDVFFICGVSKVEAEIHIHQYKQRSWAAARAAIQQALMRYRREEHEKPRGLFVIGFSLMENDHMFF